MRRITRREFLCRTAVVAAGVELGRHIVEPGVAEAAAYAESWPNVAVSQGTNNDSPETILKTALDAVGGIGRFVKPGMTVAIKPNATWDYPPHTASSTDPDMLRALILMVKAAGAKRIMVIDHPTISPAAECLDVSGIGKMLDTLGVEKVFPDRTLAPVETYTTIDLPKGKSYQQMSVIKAATEADLRINLAVAKSHVVLPVTLCLKHMMGFLANPPGLHGDLEQGLVDLNGESPVQAQLHILEAIRVRLQGMAAGYETDETNPKLVKRVNQIVVGTDPVLIDSYAVINYFGRQPREIRYIKMAGEQGLGETDIKKATDDGRLRVFTAGQKITLPTPSSTPTATPTATSATAALTPQTTATPAPPTATVPVPTNTPLPTPTAEPTGSPITPAAAAAAAGARRSPDAISPNRILSGALIPAAAVVTGAGVVVGRRLRHQEESRQTPGQEQAERAGGAETAEAAESVEGTENAEGPDGR